MNINDKQLAYLRDAAALLAPLDVAAAAAGVRDSDVRAALAASQEFANDVYAAQSATLLDLLATIAAAASATSRKRGDWRAAAFLLRCRWPATFITRGKVSPPARPGGVKSFAITSAERLAVLQAGALLDSTPAKNTHKIGEK